mgnify:CR=1 FL=1
MDEVKWAWVLFLAATLALLIRLSMWFLPAPGWRTEKVDQAAEAVSAAVDNEMPRIPEGPAPAAPARPQPSAEPVPPPPAASAEPIRTEPPPPPTREFHLRHVRWGMSPADVLAAEASAPVRKSGSGLTFVATTMELPCLLAYAFEGGRLVRARMSFSDPAGADIPPLSVAQAQRRFLYLREQLRGRYGEPVQKTTVLPRDLSDLERSAQKQGELAQQYDAEIADAERRLAKQRELLEKRYKRWSNSAEMVARGLAPCERDLKDLQAWKQEALDRADRARRNVQELREADARFPPVATMSARWPRARELHDVLLLLDLRPAVPRLDIRYESAPGLASGRKTEL